MSATVTKPSQPTTAKTITAIARACGEENGDKWEDVTPAQWDEDIAMAQWILRIINTAGYAVVPMAAQAASQAIAA